jgi:hypothetical protein
VAFGRRELRRFSSGSFFRHHLFPTTWPGSFLGSFFPQERVFNNFPASFSGSFSFVFVCRIFVFSNFLGSLLKKGILFLFFISRTAKTPVFFYRRARPQNYGIVLLIQRQPKGREAGLSPPGALGEPV